MNSVIFTVTSMAGFAQWSDVIASLYILGHNITVVSEIEELQQ